MNYQIEQKEFVDVMVAAIRYQGKYSDVGKYIGTIYKEAKGKTVGDPKKTGGLLLTRRLGPCSIILTSRISTWIIKMPSCRENGKPI